MKKFRPHQSEVRAYHHGDLRRALVQAALDLLSEEQDWAFSLREVARRAGVSHNAPYNHFADKNDLLAAVAAAGLDMLGERMKAAIAGLDDPAAELLASGLAYVRAGVENPALYRLTFGPALFAGGDRPVVASDAGANARAVLEHIVERGARTGTFAIAADDTQGRAFAVLSAWSVVHGLTLFVIDGFVEMNVPVERLYEGVAATLLNGLRPR